MSTFEQACSCGNVMIQFHQEVESHSCSHCGGSGLVEASWQEYNEYVMALDITKQEHWNIKKLWRETGMIACRECC